MATHILVVDDETAIADLVEVYLKNEGFTIHKFYNASDALACVRTTRLNLAVLDVMLPDMDGFTLCQKIRENHLFPILMLTARGEDTDKIIGFECGADDYLTKPVNFEELLLRVGALLRRCGIQHSGEIAVGGCTLHADTLLVTGEGFSYELRPREFALLQTLLAAPTKIFTRQMLMDELWGYDSESDPRTVDTHIRRLREKLAGVPDFEIQTVRGLGYRAVIR